MSMRQISYGRQVIEEDDIAAVIDTLKSDFLTQGPKVQEFEEAIAAYCEARYAVAFSNGTSALHSACLAANIGTGDEAIVPAISFVATANCLAYVGATPRFADVQAGIPLIDPESIQKKLSSKTRAIIPVHFAGSVAPLQEIEAIARKQNAVIIEDACHALGARYRHEGKWIKIGSCHHSDMTVFSFHPVKNITTGEGGMVTTNDLALYKKLKKLRQHGIVSPENGSEAPKWYYEMQELGFNFRLTDIQAALGLSQLKKLDRFLKIRSDIFGKYQEILPSIPEVSLLESSQACESALHLCIILLKKDLSRDQLFQYLRDHGIGCQLHYIPIYKHPYYRQHVPVHESDFPQAEDYFVRAISLPLHPALSEKDQNFVIQVLKDGIAQQQTQSPSEGIYEPYAANH